MNLPETIRLLTLCSAFDQRTIGEADAFAWHDVLKDLDFDECRDAVKGWYAEHRERVMPADVRSGVRMFHRIRQSDQTLEDALSVPDADPDDPAAYLRALRAGKHRDPGELKERPELRTLGAGMFRHVDEPAAIEPGDEAGP